MYTSTARGLARCCSRLFSHRAFANSSSVCVRGAEDDDDDDDVVAALQGVLRPIRFWTQKSRQAIGVVTGGKTCGVAVALSLSLSLASTTTTSSFVVDDASRSDAMIYRPTQRTTT